jgi:apolipoprotein N-acyltransferase
LKTHSREISLAACSGILTALAFPKLSLFFLGWISLIPLLIILRRRSVGRGFFLGWCAGFSFYLVLLYWIQDVPAHYGGLSWGFSAAIFFLFAAFLGLFWGIFAGLFCLLQRGFPRGAYFMGVFIWVSVEFLMSHLLTGFPWGLLGYTQYKNLWFIQVSALTGVYGLSLLLLLFQSCFVLSMDTKTRAPFLAALGLVLAVHFGGWLALKPSPRTSQTFRGAVIQGNIQPEVDFGRLTETETTALFQRHLDLSRKAVDQGASLIAWAELSVPLCFSCSHPYYQEFSQELFRFARETDCSLLLGTNETAYVRDEPKYYNTAAHLNSQGGLSFYHKRHLVPFGEYTPYKKVFSFISNFTHAIGELTPGETPVLHAFAGVDYATPICYEIIFPDLVRRFVKQGARFLVTITNDGWYGGSWAPYQHFAMAVVRAVETRRYLMRSATTGISGIIDPYGRIVRQTRLNSQDVLCDDITPLSGTTFYVRFGNWLCWLSLTLTGLFLILAVIISRRRHHHE